MEYRTAIVNELGEIKAWCDEVPGGWTQINAILEAFPEWSVRAIEQ